MPPVSRGTSSAYLSKPLLLCGPNLAKLRHSGFSESFNYSSALSLASPTQLHSYVSSFIVFIMAVHVNPDAKALAKFLQHNEAQREQRPQPLMKLRLKPAAGAADRPSSS